MHRSTLLTLESIKTSWEDTCYYTDITSLHYSEHISEHEYLYNFHQLDALTLQVLSNTQHHIVLDHRMLELAEIGKLDARVLEQLYVLKNKLGNQCLVRLYSEKRKNIGDSASIWHHFWHHRA